MTRDSAGTVKLPFES